MGLAGGVGVGLCQQHLAVFIASHQTPKEDLCSKFGMDLKRGMLLRLARRDPQLHPDNPERRAAICDKYKVRVWAWTSCFVWASVAGHLASPHAIYLPAQEFVIREEEAEWVGLTLDEAVEKQRLLEKKVSMCECQLPCPLGWAQRPSRRMGWGSALPYR